MKVVINKRSGGGFALSNKAFTEYRKRKGLNTYFYKYLAEEVYRKIGEDELNEDRSWIFSFAFNKDFGDEIKSEEFPFDNLVSSGDIKRNDPDLIAVVEELGEEANTEYSMLKIVEIPDDVEWIIEDDGSGHEWVAEKHRTWG
ncbi:hypothetical protein [Bacillus smithii]|uniref:hypothetical protein n=1 Tax=Bacillus smithii TaxID=1479 RepID=UPI002E227D7E|nr:hypothetical protein [Bacillus smithii]MED4929172.1 hypothetical protein [Bacillus smithii]